jgi:alpha-beta hydrolase superfamily lysophospholipase
MRLAQERQFTTHDGSTLFYRYWPPAGTATAERAIVLLHRGHEHSGRLQHVVDELGLDDFAMFAWDARGHGQSPGARGDSPSFAALVRDLDFFVRHLSSTHAIATSRMAVIGQSVGAVLAATWAHDYAPPIRCLVLTAPAFQVKLYVPLARPGLALIQRLFGNFFITSYVKAKFLTHDPERIRSYDEDPLVTRAISARVLLGLYDAADRVVADAQAIRLPLQLLISEKDWVVQRAPQDHFFERLGSPVKERHLLPGFLHDTLGERDRQLALDRIRAFVERIFAQPPPAESLLQAHRNGYTRDEELRLAQPLPAFSLRRLNFAVTRLAMRTLGRLSKGIRIGLTKGFDSGSSLDYVYRNQAQGALLIGKLIDRGYLDSIGWRGVRVRRAHLLRAVAAAAQLLQAAGEKLRIADVAAGHGRYVLDAVAQLPERPQSIVLRDLSELNVAQGRALIAERRLGDIACFEQGDAFDEAALATLGAPDAKPNLVTVSGLYELFSDNELVGRSLRGLAGAMSVGGYLVYTGQPWHPQIELIARTLTSHRDQRAWVMRRRTQAEMDELVRAAGFAKIEQWIDEWGMFTVSLARRL